jgi:glyoxylase-like metal-dependent hydrolase (beta-lactamase superfamily II)
MPSEALYDARTSTITWLAWDERSRDAVIIDPVLDLDLPAGVVHEESIGRLLARVEALELQPRLLIDTHEHADHLTAAGRLRRRLGLPYAIGARVVEVIATFRPVLALPDGIPADARHFDHLVHDGEELAAGTLRIRALAAPGHTPACTAWCIDDAVYTGDALFLPDSGTGRCDFPGGDAGALYDSIRRLYQLPDAVRVCVAHDYQPGGRRVETESTVGTSRRHNIHLSAETSREEFVAFRTGRDRTLKAPALLYPSLQVNLRAGELPEPDAAGRRFLQIPVSG